jgi:regulator of sigma E protease
MHILFPFIASVSALLLVISAHEFGHFLVAKLCNIKVLRFSIGFGKVLWRCRDRQGTEYALSAIPLGGYVRLLDEREGTVAAHEQKGAFNRRPFYQRFAVIIAGVGFNIIFAFLAFWLVFSIGITYVKPLVGSVIADSPAARARINSGDEIIAIDNKLTPNWAAISMALISHYGATKTVTVSVKKFRAPQQVQQIKLDLSGWRLNALRPNPLANLGISAAHTQQVNILHYPVLKASVVSFQQTLDFIKFNFIVLHKMLTGIISWKSLGGPFTIFKAAVLSADQGFVVYVNFLALLSISVATINVFPLPGLDGAQLVYLLIERIRGKPVSVAMQVLLFRLGAMLLFLLMIQVVMNDMLRFMTI